MAGKSHSHYRICPLCEACCGLEVKVEAGAVTGIRGWDGDVLSDGYVCPKGAALKDLHEDPDRLRTPLIRRDGRLVEASWEEAFAEIERRLMPILQRHGRHAAAMVSGNPSAHKMGLLLYGAKLGKALGTHNLFSASTLDQMPKQLSVGLMFGHWLSFPIPDLVRTQHLLVIGANPVVSNGSLWTVPDFRGKARDMLARGGRLVVVDPRRTETAKMASEHLFIRPGGDVFLLLGMVHTLFAEKRVKLGRLAEHVNGLDLLEAAVQPFAADAMAPRCGVAAADIARLARDLANAPSAAVYGRMGTSVQEYGTLASWLIDVLNVLTGNLDASGGAMFAKAAAFAANTYGRPGSGRGVVTGRRHSRVSKAPEVFGEFPITCLSEEIETPGEGQVRALFTVAANPVLSAPNGVRLSAALDRLELMVSLDIYLNETTRHAHVILPGLSPLEDAHYDVAFPQFSWRNQARWSGPVLEADARPQEWEILLRLAAIAAGQGADADVGELDDAQIAEEVGRLAGPQAADLLAALGTQRGPERQLDLLLRSGPYGDRFGRRPEGLTLAKVKAAPGGIDLGPLQPRIPEMLRTPSGRIELAPDMLIADLARARDDLQRPRPELVVIGRRDARSNNSWMHNLPILAKGPFRCTALVHPVDAARHGLREGGEAQLVCGNRSVAVQVELSEEMMPGVISLPHGWGHDAPGARLRLAGQRPGANLNALLPDDWRDPLSGNAVLNGIPVEIRPLQ